MRKKIYTFTFILFVILLSLYFVWVIAANIQKETLKQYLSEEWSLNLEDEKITTDGFPFKFGIKVLNFQSPIKRTPLNLQFVKLEIVRLIYNFSDVILFVGNPMISSTSYPKFKSSSDKLKVSISNKPFTGRFKLITEQEDWQLSDDRNIKKFGAKEVIFALKDAGERELDFYLQANDLNFSFLNEILESAPGKPTKFVLKGTISNSYISNPKVRYQTIKFESILLEKVDINIGVLDLVCNDMVAINLIRLTNEGNFNCLLRISSKDISRINTDNAILKNIIDLINLTLIIKNPTNAAEPQSIPIELSLDKGLIYINKIPIYQLPK